MGSFLETYNDPKFFYHPNFYNGDASTRRTSESTYHLHVKTRNVDCKIQRFAPVRLKSVIKYGHILALQFFLSFLVF